jgi:hypothetical protein
MSKKTESGVDYLISHLNGYSMPIGYGQSIRISVDEETKNEAKMKERAHMIHFAIAAYQDISRIMDIPENLISDDKLLFEKVYERMYGKEK